MNGIKRIINKKTIYVIIISLCLCLIYFFLSCMETNGIDSFITINYNTSEYEEYIEGYKDYINDIVKNAEKTRTFSVFSNDKYVSDNVEKTYSDYSGLVGVQPIVTNILGFNKYIEYIPVISIFVFFIILYCIFNTQKEYENGEIIFSYSARNGRFFLAFKRNITYSVMAIVLTVIFNVFIIILSGLLYGFPDFLVPIQSSMLFRNCTSRLSILGFCLISIFETAIGISVLTLFANLLFNIIRNKYISIVTVGTVFFAEYQLSLLAQNNSYNRFLANMNIFKIIDFSTYYRNYQNINVFGSAASSLKIMIAVTIILYAIFLFGSAIAYTYRYPISKVRFGRVRDYVEIQCGRIISYCNFLGLELYKIFIRKHKSLLIIILLLVEMFLIKETRVVFPERQLLMDDVYSQYGGADWESFEDYVEEYREIINGKRKEVNELNSASAESEDAQNNIRKISRLSSEIAEMEKILEEYDGVVSRKNEIKDQTGLTIYAMSDRGYNEIFGKNSVIREIGIMIIMSLIVVMIGSGYYLEELQSGFMALLRSSKQGVKDTFNKKLLIVSVVSFLLISLFIGIDYIGLNKLYGFKYLNAPIVSINFMKTETTSLFAGISILQYLVIDIAFKFMFYMTTLVITLICSLKFKTLFFVPIVFFLTALCGCLSIFASITIKVVLTTIMIIFLVYSISYIVRGKYGINNK